MISLTQDQVKKASTTNQDASSGKCDQMGWLGITPAAYEPPISIYTSTLACERNAGNKRTTNAYKSPKLIHKLPQSTWIIVTRVSRA